MSDGKYKPSNGTEGCAFISCFCECCIHEKFMHTQKYGDLQCDILSRTMLHDVEDKEYPEEWTFGEDGEPICTAWKKWDWGNDDDNRGLNEPPTAPPEDPNQLCMPFIFDELEINKIKKQLV